MLKNAHLKIQDIGINCSNLEMNVKTSIYLLNIKTEN